MNIDPGQGVQGGDVKAGGGHGDPNGSWLGEVLPGIWMISTERATRAT